MLLVSPFFTIFAEEATYVSSGIRLSCEPSGFFSNNGAVVYKWVGENETSTDGNWCSSLMSEPSVYSNFRTYIYQGTPQTESNTIPISSDFSYSPLFSHYFHTGLYPDEHTDKIVANLASAAFSYYECPDGEQSASPFTCVEPPEAYCGFDLPIFIAPSSLTSGSLCVTQDDGVSSCEYEVTTEQSGASNGINFTPTSEHCGCDELSAVPCADILESNSEGLNPDTGGCIQTGGVNWCPEDPEQRCNTTNGITSCDTNCGYIGELFYCGDSTLPDTNSCASGDTRSICSGILEGECPPGYDCSGNNQGATPPEACVSGDTREVCNGLSIGAIPPQTDLSGIEALLAQGNKNTQNILDAVNGKDIDNEANQADIDSKFSKFSTDQDKLNDDEKTYLETTTTEETGLLGDVDSGLSVSAALVGDLIPVSSGNCVAFSNDFGGTTITTDICSVAPYIKSILAWVINLAMAFYLFKLVTRRASPFIT